MPVATQRSCCLRFTCSLLKVQWKLLTKCVLFLCIALFFLFLGLSDHFTGWSLLSIEAAAISAFFSSAISLAQILRPILYRECACFRISARHLGIVSELAADRFIEFVKGFGHYVQDATEDQIKVLKIIGHLPQLNKLKEKSEKTAIRDRIGFRTPRDNVIYITQFPAIRREETPENPRNPLLPQNETKKEVTMGYQIPQDQVIFLTKPNHEDHIIGNLSTGAYRIAAAKKNCLRCFLLFRNSKDHYLIDELDTIYQTKSVWLPLDLLKKGLLLYGELFVVDDEINRKKRLVFEIVCGLTLKDGYSASEAQGLVEEIMARKRVKESETFQWKKTQDVEKGKCWCCTNEVTYYNDLEPFSLRKKQFTADDEIITEAVAAKFLSKDKPSGLIFKSAKGDGAPEFPYYSTWIVKDGETGELLTKFFPVKKNGVGRTPLSGDISSVETNL